MIKIIFLDIDGVIATPKSIDEAGFWTFTKECQDNLGIILKETGAKIVVSSSWRLHTVKDTVEDLREKGFLYCDSIIGVTIRAYHYIQKGIHLSIPRGVEIKQWIDTHVHSNNGKDFIRKVLFLDYSYVILDDDVDMLLEHTHQFINTNPDNGLTVEEANKAIEILNRI